MKSLLIACAAAAALGLTYAQAPAPAEELPVEQPVQECLIEERNVGDMITEFLEKKGWSDYNEKQGKMEKGGSAFWVTTGTAVIQAPVNSPNYIASRMNAFNKAMLEAKKNMVEFLSVEIATETARSYQEGEFPSADAVQEEAAETTSICGKVKALLRAKLDDALRSEGIDPYTADKEKAAAAAQKILASEEYSKTVKTTANAYVLGLQAFATFEGVEAGEKGEIGVVAIWSEKLQQMATSIVTGESVANVGAKTKIADQVSRDGKDLLSTFGVQQKINERGELVLVAFAQAGGVSESKMAAKGAQGKAKTQAMALIREFAGEQVAVATDMLNAETTTEYEDGAEVYEDASAYAEKVAATAAKMNISGISVLRNWTVKHPLNGRKVYGCICTWSPKQAALGKMLKKQMNAAKKVAEAAQAAQAAEEAAEDAAAVAAPVAAPAEAVLVPAPAKKKVEPKGTTDRYSAASEGGDEDAF